MSSLNNIFKTICFAALLFALHNSCMALGNGYLGSRIDEERSEMRYVVRIAESREPSSF